MGEFDPDTLVVEIVRRQTGNESAGPRSRFAQDLGLSENGRKTLFAFLVEAFSARGLNLPARGFFQSNFLALSTVGVLQDAIRGVLGPGKRTSAAGRAAAASPETTTKTPAKPTPNRKAKARAIATKGKGGKRKRG